METFKKILASFSAFALVLTVAATTVSAATFSDISGHWSEQYVEKLVVEGLASTDHSTFRPDDSLNRAEMVKLVIEANGGVIPGVADTPTFSDVAKTAWFYDYVETAAALDVVKGYADGTFGPARNITRAEAIKVIVEGFAVPTNLAPDEKYNDVEATDWFHDYVTTAANQCIIDGSKPNFNPQSNITRGEIAKMVINAMNYGCENVPDVEPPVTPPVVIGDGTLEVSVSASNPAGQTVPCNGTNVPYLVVDFTAGGAEDVEITNATLNIAGLGNEDSYEEVKAFDGLNQLASGRSFSGATNSATLNLSSEPIKVAAGKTTTIVFAIDMADHTCTDRVGHENYISIASVDDLIAFGADTGTGVAIAGDFPVQGNTMTIGSVPVGSLSFTEKSTTDTSADIGEKDVVATRFEVAAGSAEDVLLQGITLEQKCSADAKDIANISLWAGDMQLGEAAPSIGLNDQVLIDLTGMSNGGWLLEKGASRTLEVKVDITNGIGNKVCFEIDDAKTDVIAQGMKYGFNVGVTAWNKASFVDDVNAVTIQGGALNFSFTSTAKKVAPKSKDVEFGVLNIINAGEPVTIRGFDLIATATDDGGVVSATNATADTCILDDVKFVDANTGVTISGPYDFAVGAGPTTRTYGDDFFIDAGETLTLQLLVDVSDLTNCNGTNKGIDDGDKYKFALDMSTVEYKGETSGDTFFCGGANTDCKPSVATDPETQNYTISKAQIAFTGTTLATQTFVSKSKDVILWEGTVRANDAEDLIIRQLVFNQDVDVDDNDLETSERDNLGNLALYTVRGTTTTLEQSGVSFTGTCIDTLCGVATFGKLNEDGKSGIALKAGEEVKIIVKGDVASTLTNQDAADGLTASLALDTSGSNAVVENVDGTAATITSATPITATARVLAQSGTLKVSLKASETPDPAILLGAAANVPVASFEFDANDEKADIEDLTVGFTEVNTGVILAAGDVANDTDAIASVALYYADGTPVLKNNGSNATTFAIIDTLVPNYKKALVSGLDLQIDTDTNKVVEAYVTLNDVNSSSGIARSGMAFSAALSLNEASNDFDIKGYSSGASYLTVGALASVVDQIRTDDGTTTAEKTTAGNNMYVMNNKVVATKAATQPTQLANGTQEALKFTLTPSGDGTTYLGDVTVTVDKTGASTVGAVELYSGSTKIGSGTGTGSVAIAIDAPGATNDNVTIGGVNYNAISTAGETFTIKVTTSGGATDDVVTIKLNVNTREVTGAADDSIVWRDYGTTGTDGIEIDWIDLGSDTVTSTIENAIKNK